jgi:cupin fold WbuC family metalloprotein
VKLLSRTLLDELAAQAAASPRARAHHTLHATPADPVQRFVVVAGAQSYFRPHRHAARSELAVIVRGRFDVLTFDGHGQVTARYAAGDGTDTVAYETPPGTWHTLVPGADGGAFVEIKQGPYDPATAAEFAVWAPAEGHASVPHFLAWLRRAQPGDVVPAATAASV